MESFSVGALCAGYGGLELAVKEVFPEAQVSWFSEIDPSAETVFKSHFDDPPNLGDIRDVNWSQVKKDKPVDLVTAGYPCQPFSVAGKRGDWGKDERHLWPYVAAAVRVLRPEIVFLENVPGHRNRGFDEVLGALATAGYDTQWTSVRASDVGAPHRRDRLFAVAHTVNPNVESSDEWRPEASGGAEGGWAWPDIRRSTDIPRLPTPAVRDGKGPDGPNCHPKRQASPSLPTVLLPTARATDGPKGSPLQRGSSGDLTLPSAVYQDWGKYEPAIRAWVEVMGEAPSPTEPSNTKAGRRLNPRFVEWMMGLSRGFVTSFEFRRNATLRLLGNGVVPQQGAEALRFLLEVRKCWT